MYFIASPQKENGYTAIANEILEALCRFRIPGECRQVCDVVLRKTYGFKKRSDVIANSQITRMTGMKKQNVSRALARLIEHKVLIKTGETPDGNILEFNKNYDEWIDFVIKSDYHKVNKASSKVITKKSVLITGVINFDDKPSSKVMDTKEKRNIKETIKKEITPMEITKLFFECVESIVKKVDHPYTENFKSMISKIHDELPGMPKAFLWVEVQDFTKYWTELAQRGNKQRWQMQKTFEVSRRLGTWLRNSRNYQMKQTIRNRRGRGIALED